MVLSGNDLNGTTLADLCSRHRSFLILGIEHDDGSYSSAPEPGTRLVAGDRVIIYGSDEEHSTLTVALSVLFHGITAGPAARWYGSMSQQMGECEENR